MNNAYLCASAFHERKFRVIYFGATWLDDLNYEQAKQLVSILESKAVAA